MAFREWQIHNWQWMRGQPAVEWETLAVALASVQPKHLPSLWTNSLTFENKNIFARNVWTHSYLNNSHIIKKKLRHFCQNYYQPNQDSFKNLVNKWTFMFIIPKYIKVYTKTLKLYIHTTNMGICIITKFRLIYIKCLC